MNEYSVLDSIYYLSHNTKFGGWCIASKKNIADELDLSERTVFSAIEVCIKKSLIEKNEQGYLRTTDQWNEIMSNKHDWYIAFNGKESQFVSGTNIQQITEDVHSAKFAEPMQNLQGTMQKLQSDSADSADNNNKDNNNNHNIFISKDINTAKAENTTKVVYGNKDINNMLIALKSKIGIQGFADPVNERNIGKHCVNLLEKIGKDEFVRRLDIILEDSFKRKNCNRIKYVYNEIKAFIEPKSTSSTLTL